MTFRYTDPDSDHLRADSTRDDHGTPCIHITTTTTPGVYIPIDRLEEFIAGLRGTARQAATGAAA